MLNQDESKLARPKIFYGWWIIAVSMVVLFITIGLGYNSFGIFFKTLITEFGWSRATLSGAMSIFLLAWGFVCPVVGRLTDRHGPRRLIIWGTIALGISFYLLSLTNTLWHLYLIYALAGAAAAACSEIPVSAVVSNWFKKKRGIAMGITNVGMSLGGLALAPAVSLLILNLGWRETFLIMGPFTLVVILPLVAPIMRTRPQEMGLLPDGERGLGEAIVSNVPGNNPNQNNKVSIRTKELWLIGVIFSLASYGIIGITIHQVPFLIDMGLTLTAAAVMLGLTTGIGILSKLSFGYFADRLSPKWMMIICIALQAGGVFILMQSNSLGMVWVFVIVFGLGSGATGTLRPLVIGEFFGINSFGKNFGFTELIRRLGAAAGPFVAGYIFDISGSYYYAFITIIVAYLVGMVILFMVHPVTSTPTSAAPVQVYDQHDKS